MNSTEMKTNRLSEAGTHAGRRFAELIHKQDYLTSTVPSPESPA